MTRLLVPALILLVGSILALPLRAQEDPDGRGTIEALRTPDTRFRDLPGYSFAPHYVAVEGLRVHYVEEGPRSADPVVLLHGEPSWSYLYRTMIPILVERGHRVIAPDLVGFGRSDKPVRREAYSYANLVRWTGALLFEELDLENVTLFAQDWGGLIGLRLVAEHPDRFARVVASNTALPTGEEDFPEAFLQWQRFSQEVEELPIARILQSATVDTLPPDVLRAYEAPFPEERYKTGARMLPVLVPTSPDDPAAEANRAAWRVLAQFEKPFLTLFGDSDPVTAGAEKALQQRIPGARGQPHAILEGAGHFVQEDRGEELARRVHAFIERTSDQER